MESASGILPEFRQRARSRRYPRLGKSLTLRCRIRVVEINTTGAWTIRRAKTNFSPAHTLSGSMISMAARGRSRPHHPPHNYVATLGWDRVISATMLNEFRLNFTRYDFDQTQPVGAPISVFRRSSCLTSICVRPSFGSNNNLIGIAQSSTTPGALAQNTYGLAETFSWVRNRHALKFGVEARKEQNNNDQPGEERPLYQFRGLLNLANDAVLLLMSKHR